MEATRLDDGKPKIWYVPGSAISAMARVFEFGAKKYHAYNYKTGKGLDLNRVYDSAFRHLIAWNDGEDNDRESGLPHLHHAITNIAMLIDLIELGKGKEYRFKK